MRSETSIEKAVVKIARSHGWRACKVAFIAHQGAPDCWFFADGKILMVEFKKPGGPLRENQKTTIEWMNDMVFDVHVIDNEEAGRDLFQR